MTLQQECELIEQRVLENSESKPIYQKAVPKGTKIDGKIVEIISYKDYDIVRYTK